MNLTYNKSSFDNAIQVDNYPWGFRLKTNRRYWIETKKNGDRLCYCTLNPKTSAWCAVKKSTYNAVELLYFDKNNHVKTFSIYKYGTSEKELNEFLSKINYDSLNDLQKKQICKIKSVNKVIEKVSFKITKVSEYNLSDPVDIAKMRADSNSPETLKREKEQNQIKQHISDSINNTYKHCLIKNKLTKESA